jgi:F-type H+-transporting ATPase subunit b
MISFDYTLIIVILNFILLMIILNKLLYKPIKTFLAERQKSIAEDMEQAEKSKFSAAEILQKQEEEFKRSAQEIRKMKEQAKKDAESQGDEIIKQARLREKEVLADTEKQLVHEKQKVMQAIEGELAERISGLTTAILGKKLDEQIDAEMINRLLAEDRSKK